MAAVDQNANYAHTTFTTGKNTTFAFEDPRSAEVVANILRAVFKGKQIIHKGRKP